MNKTNINIGQFLGSEFGEGFGYPNVSINLPSVRDVLKFTLFNLNFLSEDKITNKEAFRYKINLDFSRETNFRITNICLFVHPSV